MKPVGNFTINPTNSSLLLRALQSGTTPLKSHLSELIKCHENALTFYVSNLISLNSYFILNFISCNYEVVSYELKLKINFC